MVSSQTRWQISGDYFENCNCQVVCPCPLSGLQAMPTEGHCDVPLAFHIDQGRFGETQLDGLNVVVVLYTPGPMAQGNWSVAAYIDERADDAQRQALGAIFSGAAGGPLGGLGPLITTNLGAKFVPIQYSGDGKTRRVTIPDVLDMNVEGLAGANPDEAIYLDNVGHPVQPVGSRLAIAQGTRTTFEDHGFTWDNTGRNGNYAPFSWQGP